MTITSGFIFNDCGYCDGETNISLQSKIQNEATD